MRYALGPLGFALSLSAASVNGLPIHSTTTGQSSKAVILVPRLYLRRKHLERTSAGLS